MRYGALHDPDSPALAHALDYTVARVASPVTAAPLPTPNWFRAWRWPATGNALGNDEVSNCCEAADLVMLEGFRAARGLSSLPPDTLTELAMLRYETVTGYDGSTGTDLGSVPAEDCFAWQTAPIVAAGTAWRVRWLSVRPSDVVSALRRGPLQVTLGLTEADADDFHHWHVVSPGEFIAYHRVVVGTAQGDLLTCRTWGMDVPVHLSRVVAADLLVPVGTPTSLRTAGLDWTTVLA